MTIPARSADHPGVVTRLTPMILLAFALVPVACGPRAEPFYSDDLGIQAVPVAPGALAGTFALFLESSTIVDAPLVGEKPSGGDSWYLVDRTWDPETGTYAETQRPCGGITFETAGATTTISLDAWRSLGPSMIRRLEIDDLAGTYALDGHLELWGLEGLPDPYGSALPADKEEAAQAPFKDWIVDMDEDGHPGMTAHVESIVTGDHYFVQRRMFDLEGITLGADRIVGLDHVHIEKTTLGATSSLLESQTPQRPDPDPLESWFVMQRVDPSLDCDGLTRKVDMNEIGGRRPF